MFPKRRPRHPQAQERYAATTISLSTKEDHSTHCDAPTSPVSWYSAISAMSLKSSQEDGHVSTLKIAPPLHQSMNSIEASSLTSVKTESSSSSLSLAPLATETVDTPSDPVCFITPERHYRSIPISFLINPIHDSPNTACHTNIDATLLPPLSPHTAGGLEETTMASGRMHHQGYDATHDLFHKTAFVSSPTASTNDSIAFSIQSQEHDIRSTSLEPDNKKDNVSASNSDAEVWTHDALPSTRTTERSLRRTKNPDLKTTKTGKIQHRSKRIGVSKRNTAYNRFLQQQSKHLAKYHSHLTPQQRMKRIAEEWALSEKNTHTTRRKSRFSAVADVNPPPPSTTDKLDAH